MSSLFLFFLLKLINLFNRENSPVGDVLAIALHCVPYIVALDGGGVSAVLVLDGESQHFSLPLSFLSVCIIAHGHRFVKGF